MLNYFSMEYNYRNFNILENFQIIEFDNSEDVELNIKKQRKIIKEGMKEKIFAAKDIKSISFSTRHISMLAIDTAYINGVYADVSFENEKGDKHDMKCDIPIGVIIEWDKLYGTTVYPEDCTINLNMPKDTEELKLIYVNIQSKSFYPVSAKFESVNKLLKSCIANDDTVYNKDNLYCTDNAGYLYYGKVKVPTLSITTNKEKNTKTLSWKNKYKEVHLFANHCYGDTIELVKLNEQKFNKKFHKDFINERCSSDGLRTELGLYRENFSEYKNVYKEEKDVFNKIYEREISKVKSAVTPGLKDKIFEALHNLDNRYDVIKNFVETGELTVDAGDKKQVGILNKIQRIAQCVVLFDDVDDIKDIFKKCDVEFDNFIFSEDEIINNHEYVFTGTAINGYYYSIRNTYIMLGNYYTKSFEFEGSSGVKGMNVKTKVYTTGMNIKTNDKYEKKLVYTTPNYLKHMFKCVVDNDYNELAVNYPSDRFISFNKKEDIFPLYDEGKLDFNDINNYNTSKTSSLVIDDKLFDEFIEKVAPFLSTGFVTNLAKFLSSDDCSVNIVDSNNLFVSTSLYNYNNTLERLFKSICCKEERDMLHMLDTFSDFNLFLDFLQNFLEKKGEVK